MDWTTQLKPGLLVNTADNTRLGETVRLYRRREGVNPQLKLYEQYLAVRNWELGDQFYVPTEFVAGIDPEAGVVNLSLTLREIEEATFSRLPDFVVNGRAETISLS